MLILQIPCRVTKENQLEAKLDLLGEYRERGYQLGLEIVGPWDDFFSVPNIESIQKNLRRVPKSAYLSLHAPYDARVSWERNFFSSSEGLANLRHIFDLADLLGVRLVNLHASLFHTYDQLRARSVDGLEGHKKELISRVTTVLGEIHDRYPRQEICLENMPYCWDHDLILDPKDMIYEICFVDLEDFFQVVCPQKNIFATIDTCHLAAVLDSSELLKEIEKLGNGLGHVHLTDIQNTWQPFFALAKEGVVPGEGRIGERIFRELLRYFLDFSQKKNLSVVLEIQDKDLVQLKNLRASFKKVVGWLDEIKRGR